MDQKWLNSRISSVAEAKNPWTEHFSQGVSTLNNISRTLSKGGMSAYSSEVDGLITKLQALEKKSDKWVVDAKKQMGRMARKSL